VSLLVLGKKKTMMNLFEEEFDEIESSDDDEVDQQAARNKALVAKHKGKKRKRETVEKTKETKKKTKKQKKTSSPAAIKSLAKKALQTEAWLNIGGPRNAKMRIGKTLTNGGVVVHLDGTHHCAIKKAKHSNTETSLIVNCGSQSVFQKCFNCKDQLVLVQSKTARIKKHILQLTGVEPTTTNIHSKSAPHSLKAYRDAGHDASNMIDPVQFIHLLQREDLGKAEIVGNTTRMLSLSQTIQTSLFYGTM
jgi:hypothetical protein